VTPGSSSASRVTRSLSADGFILKLNPSGSTALISILGFGGGQIALDREGNIFAAGALTGPVPTTPNAFQSSTEHEICSTSFLFGPFPCRHQHIAKIDPSGRQLIFGTYLSGYFGAIPAAMVLDDDGNVIVAGVTSSADFPTTTHAYQPQYLFDPNSSSSPRRTRLRR